MKGKGEEHRAFDTPIVQAQGYTRITARQVLGNTERFQAGILRIIALKGMRIRGLRVMRARRATGLLRSAPHGRLLASVPLGYVGTHAGWCHVPRTRVVLLSERLHVRGYERKHREDHQNEH